MRQVLHGKEPLARVPRVGLAQHRVAVARHHLASLERRAHKRLQLLAGGLRAHLRHHGMQPAEHLLLRQAWSGVEGEREEREERGEDEPRECGCQCTPLLPLGLRAHLRHHGMQPAELLRSMVKGRRKGDGDDS